MVRDCTQAHHMLFSLCTSNAYSAGPTLADNHTHLSLLLLLL
jgi:hypothetical protein